MRLFSAPVLLILSALTLSGQKAHLAAIYEPSDEPVSYLLFKNDVDGYDMLEAFRARREDLANNHPLLNVAGDFTGDGMDEIALFNDLDYTPNMNPGFTCSAVSVSRPSGTGFIPSGTWFSTPDTMLDFNFVNFSVAGDYNLDGLCDIALFYNDPSLDQLSIYLLESTGSGFSAPQTWYSVERSEFNFTAIRFACPGDFNGNGIPDIAVFYNYFGTAPGTVQSVFLFEPEGDSFSLLPAVYIGTKAEYDFSNIKFALPGDYNLDGYSDIAVLLEDTVNKNLDFSVFKGSENGQLSPALFNSYPGSVLEPSRIVHACSGDYAGDTASDLALYYDNPISGNQEILLMESNLTYFKVPESVFSEEPGVLSMAAVSSVLSGNFIQRPFVAATTWLNDRAGALTFTFDDGYRGAFEYGAAELEAAALKGTFYIFTDTTRVYDGELAPTSLIRSYKEKGHEIGSHTVNHSNLGLLTATGETDSLEQVLATSVDVLNERFDQQTYNMSIPYGSFRYETLGYLSRYFLSARSSQWGFNLATPYDFYALKSWPVLSTTSPSFVNNLLQLTETYGYYFLLMYHDFLDEPFDEEVLIYTYDRQLFHETVQLALGRDLWIDTHVRIYKYIRERNSLKIVLTDIGNMNDQPGHFSFTADDGLADSLFDVELTLKILLPESWIEDTVSVVSAGSVEYMPVRQNETKNYILFNWLPTVGGIIEVHEGRIAGTGFAERDVQQPGVKLTAAPNPFLHESVIGVSGPAGTEGYLVIRDLHGRVVRKIRADGSGTYLFSREGLASGIYLVQMIESGREVAVLKVMAR